MRIISSGTQLYPSPNAALTRTQAAANLGQLADRFWLAGHTGRVFHKGCRTHVFRFSQRLPHAEEEKLHDTWPLFPPLPLLYPGEARRHFSGWRLRPSRVQLVSLPAALGGGSREDWKAPEVARADDGSSWVVTCRGGM